MIAAADLLLAVDAAFADGGPAGWPDPHAGRPPDDDEHSRRQQVAGAPWLAVGERWANFSLWRPNRDRHSEKLADAAPDHGATHE